MKDEKIIMLRKEVVLPQEVVADLEYLAAQDKRPLKNYMEKVLTDKTVRAKVLMIGKFEAGRKKK